MASSISRFVVRATNSRLYSVQAARKVENAGTGATQVAKVNGVSVGTLPNRSPVCRVTVAVKAGARHEDEGNLGVSHCLRHAVQVANQSNLSFEIIKQLQFMAGRFSVNTTREATYYNLECLPDQIEASLQVLGPIIARTEIDEYNWAEFGGFKKQLERDICLLKNQPNIEVTELLHAAAFRGSLGNSLYAMPQFIGSFSRTMLMNFISNNYQASRTSIAGMGVDMATLSDFANFLTFAPAGQPYERRAKYIGGEQRENRPSAEMTYAAIATEAPSLASKDLIAAVILQEAMHTENSLKYSGSERSRLAQAVSKAVEGPYQVSSFGAFYSDSGLFGFVLGAAPEEMDKALHACVGEFAAVTRKGFSDEAIQVAKTKAKLRLLELNQRPDVQLQSLAEQQLVLENPTTTDKATALIDAVKPSEVNSVANKIINGKPSMSAVGNLIRTPFMDELFK